MEINTNDILNSILDSLDKVDYIRPEDIPNIDLYMDQVTTFMDTHFTSTKRYPDDKILTKTMINNYTKNNLLPPSVKKKYSRKHMILLILIYYFKNILSIKDIETVLTPLKEKYFSEDSNLNISDLYKEVCEIEKSRIEPLKTSVKEAYEKSLTAFSQISDESERNELQLFTFICSLSFDVYLKKVMIEKIIDELADKPTRTDKNEKKSK